MCVCYRLQELKGDGVASGSGTPQVVSSSVRILAQALVHIEQGIERRFLKAPLGESPSRPGKVWNMAWRPMGASLQKITRERPKIHLRR